MISEAAELHELGKHKESLALIEWIEKRPKKLSPKATRQLRFLKADVFHDLGRFRDAIACYEALLEEEPCDTAHANKGLCHWELREHKIALKSYLAAIRLNPGNAIAQRGAGEMKIKLDTPAASIPFFERAIAIDRRYQAAYTSLGIAHFRVGAWSKADKMFHEALRLDPHDDLAREGAARIAKHFED